MELLLTLSTGLELSLAEFHREFAFGAVLLLLLNDSGGVLGHLRRMLEVIAAATRRLALHEVILSGHTLTHIASS